MRLPRVPEKLPARQVQRLAFVGLLLLAAILIAVAYRIMQPAQSATKMGATRPNSGLEIDASPVISPFASSIITTGGTSGGTSSGSYGYADAEPPALPTATADPQLPLLGRRVGLDPGHGPRDDLGAVLVDTDSGALTLSEAAFNLDVALRCRDILLARGADVALTRENSDTFTAPWPADVNGDGVVGGATDDLQLRIDILNSFGAEAFLSIHANGGKRDLAVRQDVQALYCGTSDCALPAENKLLGGLVLDHLSAQLEAVGYPASGELLTDLSIDSSDPPEHLFILGPANTPRHVRAIAMPGALVESLYVTYPTHAAQLKQDVVRQAIALAYADALQAYLIGESSR